VGGEGNRHPAAGGMNGCKAGEGRRRHFVDDDESKRFSSGAGVRARVGVAVKNRGVQALNKQLPVIFGVVAFDANCPADVEDKGERQFPPNSLEFDKV
jgi:hypothetical protein